MKTVRFALNVMSPSRIKHYLLCLSFRLIETDLYVKLSRFCKFGDIISIADPNLRESCDS